MTDMKELSKHIKAEFDRLNKQIADLQKELETTQLAFDGVRQAAENCKTELAAEKAREKCCSNCQFYKEGCLLY
jgi:cell division protein FtsB